jgi:DnaJ-class molecular chaperone
LIDETKRPRALIDSTTAYINDYGHMKNKNAVSLVDYNLKGMQESIADAALGKEIEIPTLDGRVSLKIPEATQTGKLFRLRGKGVRPVRSSMVGDLLCRIVVETPVNLNSRQRELLKELQASLDGDGHASSPKKKSFFDRWFN